MRDRITKILEHWFIQEPIMFQVLCTHEIVENRKMDCPIRSGKRRVEYNPDYVGQMTDLGLDEALRSEACRILLKHPYERRPEGCCNQAISIGSNIVVGDNYDYSSFNIERPADFDLKKGMPYEWYSRKIQEMLPPDSGSEGNRGAGSGNGDGNGGNGDGNGGDGGDGGQKENKLRQQADRNRALSELWDEDDMTVAMINDLIENSQDWGSIPGAFVERLKASTKAKINWRNLFNGFRASILSSKRKLTRMRPNRRSGFEQMGSVRTFDTKLLVAVDVSGSISKESLGWFYGVINSAFRYGFECIDVIQFDCGVKMIQSLKKAIKETVAVGRGGTDFQEPVNYAHENGYDGLMILTDGYAEEPVIPENMRCKIIWVCQNRQCYERHHKWMEKSGRVCTIELD